MSLKRIDLRITEEALEQLAALALRTKLSVSENIRRAIDARLIEAGLQPKCGHDSGDDKELGIQ